MNDDVKALVERLLEPDYHDPACPFRNHCYCDDGAPHDTVRHPLAFQAAAALTAQAEEIKRLQLRLGSLGANPNMDQDIADLCARLGAMHSHRGDDIPTQFVNPDGKDAVAAIEKLNAALKAAQEVGQ